MKIVVYTDGGETSHHALRYAAEMVKKLGADLAVITVRTGTHAAETLPPFGRAVSLNSRQDLPTGLERLTRALDVLTAAELFDPQATIEVNELPNGHVFVCNNRSGHRVPFYVCFGNFIEILNDEIDRQGYDLLITAPPKRSRLKQMATGSVARKLLLNLNASVLILRDKEAGNRFLICADGSTAAKRPFPLLKRLLPFILQTVELVYVQTPEDDPETVQTAFTCLEAASQWLTSCGKDVRIHHLEGKDPAESIASIAGAHAVIFLGASLRHDVYRRMRGSLAMQLLNRASPSNVLVAKALPEGDENYLGDPINFSDTGIRP